MYNQQDSLSEESDLSNAAGTLLIGKVVAFNDRGNPLVSYDDKTKQTPIEALTTVPLSSDTIGKEVAISFATNNGVVAIVMGVIRRALDDVLEFQSTQNTEKLSVTGNTNIENNIEGSSKKEAIVDGEKLELSATEEVTIRCGKASITLNKNGKILIKGEHMLNRTSGSYRIKSGSIQLN